MLTTNDLGAIEKLIKNLLEPIKRVQAGNTKKLDGHTNKLNVQEKILDAHTKVLGKHSRQLNEISQKLTTNTASVIKIENKIDAALELRKDVADVREKFEDHEERISNLEKFS